MARAWIWLILLCLVASPASGCRKKCSNFYSSGSPRVKNSFRLGSLCHEESFIVAVFLGLGGLVLAGCCCFCLCSAWEESASGTDPEIARIQREMAERQPKVSTSLGGCTPKQSSTVDKTSVPMQERVDRLEETMEKTEEESLLPQENVVQVQLVDENLVNLEVPPAEVTITTFTKLLADLAFYSGKPDVQGLLVKSHSGNYVQVFDIARIPKGDLKVRVVETGDKHFLRIYSNTQLAE